MVVPVVNELYWFYLRHSPFGRQKAWSWEGPGTATWCKCTNPQVPAKWAQRVFTYLIPHIFLLTFTLVTLQLKTASKCLELTTHASTTLENQTMQKSTIASTAKMRISRRGDVELNTSPTSLLPATVSNSFVSAGAHQTLDSFAPSHLTYKVNPFSFG